MPNGGNALQVPLRTFPAGFAARHALYARLCEQRVVRGGAGQGLTPPGNYRIMLHGTELGRAG